MRKMQLSSSLRVVYAYLIVTACPDLVAGAMAIGDLTATAIRIVVASSPIFHRREGTTTENRRCTATEGS